MKITIEWEDDKGDTHQDILEGVNSCLIIGSGLHKELTHYDFNRQYTAKTKDAYYNLIGKCHEAIERLRVDGHKITS